MPIRKFNPTSPATRFKTVLTFDEITTDEPAEDLADNWLNSMRSRTPPIYDVLKGYQVTVAIQLGVQSYREGRALGYDPATRRIVQVID